MSEDQGTPGFYILINGGNSASIILQDNLIHLHATQAIKIEGMQKPPLQPLEQPKEAEEKGLTAMDWCHMGLAVLGCIPIIGTVANVVDAGLLAYEGNYAEAALSLAAAIPGPGEAVALARVASKARLLGKAVNAAAKFVKVGKALQRVGTVARWFIAGKFLYMAINNRDKIANLLEKMRNGQFNWKDPRFWTFVACVALNLARGRMTKAMNKKLGIGVAPTKADLDAYRSKLGVSDANTVAVGKSKTGIPALDASEFNGASPKVRQEAGLPDLDTVAPNRDIKAPTNVALNNRHAEEGLMHEFDEAVKGAGLNPKDVGGTLNIHQSNPKGVCPTCLQGLNNPNVKPGIFKQFSEKYPNLQINVTSEAADGVKPFGKQSFSLLNGKYIEPT